MKRRDHLVAVETAPLPGLDPAYFAAREKLAAGKAARKPISKREYRRTKEKLSAIGFGGMVVKDVTPKQAARRSAQAVPWRLF